MCSELLVVDLLRHNSRKIAISSARPVLVCLHDPFSNPARSESKPNLPRTKSTRLAEILERKFIETKSSTLSEL